MQKCLLTYLLLSLSQEGGLDRICVGEDENDVFSFAVWTEGIETLLPRTERVMFFRPGAVNPIAAAAPWHKMEKIVGHLLTDTDLYPRRYLVSEFPSDEELTQLGKELS
jgi:hypothetical protein